METVDRLSNDSDVNVEELQSKIKRLNEQIDEIEDNISKNNKAKLKIYDAELSKSEESLKTKAANPLNLDTEVHDAAAVLASLVSGSSLVSDPTLTINVDMGRAVPTHDSNPTPRTEEAAGILTKISGKGRGVRGGTFTETLSKIETGTESVEQKQPKKVVQDETLGDKLSPEEKREKQGQAAEMRILFQAFTKILSDDKFDPTVEEIVDVLKPMLVSVKGGKKYKTAKHKRDKKKYTQKAGKSILGKCYVIDLPNNNVKVIIGRRRYYTKHFDINPIAKDLLREVANNPFKKNNCIAIARKLDIEFKNLKQEYKK